MWISGGFEAAFNNRRSNSFNGFRKLVYDETIYAREDNSRGKL
jgi:hypothetical protein